MVSSNKFARQFKRIDIFYNNIEFRENKGNNFQTVFGALISLAVALVVALYGTNKFMIMRDYGDTQFNEYIVRDGLESTEFK